MVLGSNLLSIKMTLKQERCSKVVPRFKRLSHGVLESTAFGT